MSIYRVLHKVRVDDQPGLVVLAVTASLLSDGLVGQTLVLLVHAALNLASLRVRNHERILTLPAAGHTIIIECKVLPQGWS